MRTNIEIDDELIATAMRVSGLSTKRAIVEEALKRFVDDHQARQAIENMRGMGWDGDLDEMRRNSFKPFDE